MSIRFLSICLLLFAGVAKVNAGFEGSALLSLTGLEFKLAEVDDASFSVASGSFQNNMADLSIQSQLTDFGTSITIDGVLQDETSGSQLITGSTIFQIGDFDLSGVAIGSSVPGPDGGTATVDFSGSFVDLSGEFGLATPSVGGNGSTEAELFIASNGITGTSGANLNSNTTSVEFIAGGNSALQLSGFYDLKLSLENVVPKIAEPLNASAASNFTVTLNANNQQGAQAYTASLDLPELNQSIAFGDSAVDITSQAFDTSNRWVGTLLPIDSNGNLILQDGFTYNLTFIQTSSVSLMPVPEPSTSIVVLTLLSCGVISRRRRK